MYDPQGLRQAVAGAGSVQKLANILNVSRQAIYQWMGNEYCPELRAIQIEEALNIPRHLIDTNFQKKECA